MSYTTSLECRYVGVQSTVPTDVPCRDAKKHRIGPLARSESNLEPMLCNKSKSESGRELMLCNKSSQGVS
jgi:hypothetical protein